MQLFTTKELHDFNSALTKFELYLSFTDEEKKIPQIQESILKSLEDLKKIYQKCTVLK